MKTGITIKSAKYLSGFKIKITFSDGRVNVFDYESMVTRNHEESVPYRNIEKFKKFRIDNSSQSIVWGKDWDMLLTLDTIYNKNKVSFSGRKKVADKVIPISIYVRQSVVDSLGGKKKVREMAQKNMIY